MDFVDGGGSAAASDPTPKSNTGPGIIDRISNFFNRLFGGKKSTSTGHAVKATIISMTLIPEGVAAESSGAAVGTGLFSTAGLTAGAIFWPTMIAEPEFNWTRQFDGSTDIPITTTGTPQDPTLYLYRNMRSVNGVPMVGEGLDKLGLRDRDVNNLSSSTMITPFFENGLSVTIGYGNVVPPNVPDFARGKGTLFRTSASSLLPYGLVGLPVPNANVPNYGQIRPATPMNVGTFRTLIQSTAPAWQPVK